MDAIFLLFISHYTKLFPCTESLQHSAENHSINVSALAYKIRFHTTSFMFFGICETCIALEAWLILYTAYHPLFFYIKKFNLNIANSTSSPLFLVLLYVETRLQPHMNRLRSEDSTGYKLWCVR